MSNFQELCNADIARYGGNPELYIKLFLFLYRKSATVLFVPAKFLCKALFRFLVNRRCAEIVANQNVERGFTWGYAYNITINNRVLIGSNCKIHKGGVIGQAYHGPHKGYSTIGDRVWIGINSAIVGNVNIGDDVMIAPNCFVNVDIPSHSVVFGNPCIFKHRAWATEGYVNNIIE